MDRNKQKSTFKQPKGIQLSFLFQQGEKTEMPAKVIHIEEKLIAKEDRTNRLLNEKTISKFIRHSEKLEW